MPISVLLLSCGDLLPELLNCSPELHQLLCPCLCIRHVRDGSVGQNGPDSGLYAEVETIFSEEQCDAGRGMNAVIVGKLG